MISINNKSIHWLFILCAINTRLYANTPFILADINFSLGSLTISAASWPIDEHDELDALLDEVDGVRINIYKIDNNNSVVIDILTQSNIN